MIKFIRNIPWKEILVIGLLAALGIGAVVGIGAALTAKTETVSALKFERGAIDSTGAFVESDTSIYTADYIECQGLRIEPDFDATGTYQVFYYNSNKQFVAATDVMNTSEKPVYDKGNTFAIAKYCKIVITPETPKDNDGYVVEDYKIKFYEVAGIAGKFNITVNKKQVNLDSVDLFKSATYKEGSIFNYDSVTLKPKDELNPDYNYAKVFIKNTDSLKISYKSTVGSLTYGFFDANDCYISGGELTEDVIFTISVPANSEYFYIIYKSNNLPVVNIVS